MKTLKLVWLTFVQLVGQVRQIPQSISKAVKLRQRKTVAAEHEAERLDRILNPSKYRGK
jgi:hypothetical protein